MNEWPEDAFAGYLAGIIDGEGCIEIIGDYSVRLRIGNTIQHTLCAIQERLGFGRVREDKTREKNGFKRLWVFEVSSCKDVGRVFDICGRYIHMKPDQMAHATAIIGRVKADLADIDWRNKRILEEVDSGRMQKEIAAEFGVSPQLVSFLKRGHTWSTVISAHRSRALDKSFPRSKDQVFRLHGEPANDNTKDIASAAA